MDSFSISVNERFDRLQRRLIDMTVGDTLSPADAATESGLAPDVCLAVLLGLERAGFMAREGQDRFVRRTLSFDA